MQRTNDSNLQIYELKALKHEIIQSTLWLGCWNLPHDVGTNLKTIWTVAESFHIFLCEFYVV